MIEVPRMFYIVIYYDQYISCFLLSFAHKNMSHLIEILPHDGVFNHSLMFYNEHCFAINFMKNLSSSPGMYKIFRPAIGEALRYKILYVLHNFV